MLEYIAAAMPSITAGSLLSVGGALIHWGLKVNKSIGNTVRASESLAEKLNGHEVLDNARFAAATAAIERVERIALAQKPAES